MKESAASPLSPSRCGALQSRGHLPNRKHALLTKNLTTHHSPCPPANAFSAPPLSTGRTHRPGPKNPMLEPIPRRRLTHAPGKGPTIAGNSQHWNLPVLFSVALSLRSTDADVRLRTIPMAQSRRRRCQSSRLLRMVRGKGKSKKSAVVAISASRLGN